jgi:hypothetical protein
MLPVVHWWTLREKFKQSIPGVVTDNYLATTLRTQLRSARANVFPYLKDIGLIDDEGKTQELATAWRDDNQYTDVCRKIRSKLYPDDLISAVPNPSEDRQGVQTWFANRTGAGSAAVKRMAAIYIVISEADISKRPPKKGKKATGGAKRKAAQKTAKIKPDPTPSTAATREPHPHTPPVPGVYINLQIHISSDSTPDQIDKIFESIAAHIYAR